MADQCPLCKHPTRPYGTKVADYPGTRLKRGKGGVCKKCLGGVKDPKPRPGSSTHCLVCQRALRPWGVRAEDAPKAVKKGDSTRCSACVWSNREVLNVDELNEVETQWVKDNVPTDLHWYFGVIA